MKLKRRDTSFSKLPAIPERLLVLEPPGVSTIQPAPRAQDATASARRVVDDRFRLLVSAVSNSPRTAYRFVDANPMRCDAGALDAQCAARPQVATHAVVSDADTPPHTGSSCTDALVSLQGQCKTSRDEALGAAIKAAPAVHATDLTGMSVEEQRQLMGERLLPLVGVIAPDVADKVVGMLLDNDVGMLLTLLTTASVLRSHVATVLGVLAKYEDTGSPQESKSKTEQSAPPPLSSACSSSLHGVEGEEGGASGKVELVWHKESNAVVGTVDAAYEVDWDNEEQLLAEESAAGFGLPSMAYCAHGKPTAVTQLVHYLSGADSLVYLLRAEPSLETLGAVVRTE